MILRIHILRLVGALFLACSSSHFVVVAKGATEQQNLADLDYAVYPRRTEEEAAVLEWGHSAIISALDASVAYFGPQTSQAALLEVECKPVLASPLNGYRGSKSSENDEETQRDTEEDIIVALDNADDVHGNMVVMTNNGGLTGVEMAKIAKLSGAAALLVVNIDEERPDDIYRLTIEEHETDKFDMDEIDIPVVMISLNSANVLTTATVTPDMSPSDIVNHGMPERVRLYAGGDRPFFEDVEPIDPTLYLIHNLLTEEEVENLVDAAKTKVSQVDGSGKDDILQYSSQSDKYHNVERVLLWQGMLQTPAYKAIEERIEQVTGFPAAHYSDFIVDKLDTTTGNGSYWKPHYDTHPHFIPMATITVFLTDVDSGGCSVVYPSCKQPVKVLPSKGMAIVHHNTNDKHELDLSTVHGLLPGSKGDGNPIYIARKYIFTTPVPTARRLALPIFAAPFGGKLPGIVVTLHDVLVEKFGIEDGSFYFDKACVFIPLLITLLIAQYIAEYIQGKVSQATSSDSKAAANKKNDSSNDNKPARKSKRGKRD